VGKKKLGGLLVMAAAVGAALVVASPAFAWQVTLTAEPKLKRTHSWEITKSVSQPTVTVKAGETADVTYTVTATKVSSVDSDFRVDGTAHLARDPNIDVNDVEVNIQLQDIIFDRNPIPADVTCNPPFPVDLAVTDVNCVYGAALPDTTPRNVVMRATLVGGGRVATQEFDFLNATVDEVDESITVTDPMGGGTLGTVNASEGTKTFTYTKTIGPFSTSECGQKTIDNTATYTTGDTGATGSASAGVDVTVTCPPPEPKCQLPSLVWGFVALVGSQHVKPLLPITLGTPGGSKTVTVTSTTQTIYILAKEIFTSNGIDLLSAELLAAKLNAATGRDVSSIQATMDAADAFLASNSSSGWSYLSSTKKAQVNGWVATLEAYNNKCIPEKPDTKPPHRCKKHWDKSDHDWHKWNWKKFDWDD
jgi:hypothetical protein